MEGVAAEGTCILFGRGYLRTRSAFLVAPYGEVLASRAPYKLPQLYVMPQDVEMAPGP